MAEHILIVGDIGGTNARFALADPAGTGFVNERTLQCADFNSAEVAIQHYLDETGTAKPNVICLAVAGPVVNNSVRMPNNPWHISVASLQQTFTAEEVTLLNDFEAIAHSLPAVNRTDVACLGHVAERDLDCPDFTVCVLGPGTGLGAAALVSRRGVADALVTEAGHVGFAPESDLQAEVLNVLRRRYDRVSDERLVSGMGVENVHWALGQIAGEPEVPTGAAGIFDAAREDSSSACGQAVALFFELLGQVAGNLVLSTGAFDGVYIAGGVAQRHGDLLQASRFREGFENKGRHRELMTSVPSHLILHAQPGLLGASRKARILDGAIA